jgi:hypothetical protein
VAIDPPSQTVAVGQPVTVKLLVTGLEAGGAAEIIGAVDLDIEYDPGLLAPTDVTLGSSLADGPASSFQSFDLSTPGVVDLAEVSLLADSALESTQPGSFLLATIAFNTLTIGMSSLTVVFDQFNDVKGFNADVLILEARNGTVTAGVPQAPITDLVARAKDKKIDLQWTPVTGAKSYTIYRRAGTGSYVVHKAGHVTSTGVYADTGLSNGTKYCYKVRWVNTNNQESPDSNEACATPKGR